MTAGFKRESLNLASVLAGCGAQLEGMGSVI